MRPIVQARLPLAGEVEPRLTSAERVFVGVQNIALARIDRQIDDHRVVLLNLYGTADIDRLIEALQSVRATMVEHQEELAAYLKNHPESVLPGSLPA